MTKQSKLYDPSGNLIPSADDGDSQPLPVGVQALIETRINTAIDNLREHNRGDLKDLARDHTKKWRWLAIISSAITLITIFYAPDKILSIISTQIDTKLTEPMLISSADRLIETKMSKYVSEKLSPLTERATKLESSIDEMDSQIKQKQRLLELGQTKLQGQLHIQELAISSKAGSKKSYMDLIEMSKDPNSKNDLINASLKEIEQFYDVDRNQVSFKRLVKTETMQDPGFSVDEAMLYLLNAEELKEAAINTLSLLKSKATIAELCKIVLTSEDLRLVNRAIRAIDIISEERIRPLDFKKVETWWKQNKDKKEFQGSYDGYCEVIKSMWKKPIQASSIETFIKDLSSTIKSDPMALHSMCLKAGFLIMKGNIEEAKTVLNDVHKVKSDYYWYYVWNASLKIKEGDLESAVSSLNSAFKKSPTFDVVATIMFWDIFDPIIQNPKINWPNNNSAQQ